MLRIGLCADTQFADSFFCDVARAAEEEAAANGLCLLQCHWQDSFEASWPRMQSLFSVAGLCGAVLAGQFAADEIKAFQKHASRVVLLDSPAPLGTEVASVESDYRNGCLLALEHLIERDAKRLLVVTGPTKEHYFAQAVVSATQSVRSRYETIKIIYSDLTAEMGYKHVCEQFKNGCDFDSFLGNDELAMGALHGLDKLGLRVPDDVKVVGFDDIAHAAIVRPELTTVHIDKSQLGREAVRTLVALVRAEGQSNPITKVLKGNLMVREST